MYNLTETTKKALEIAENMAKELGHKYVGTEHILYGLIKEGKGIASKVLESQGITENKVKSEILRLIGKNEKIEKTEGFTPRTKKVLENSYQEAKKEGLDYIGTEHILLGITKEGDSIAVRILINLKVNFQKLYSEIAKITNEDILGITKSHEKIKGKTSQTITQFGVDLTQLAVEGKLDKVIGREEELERIIQILLRRTKNNPCLIGEPGVGKTAVVEGLAIKIINEDVPEELKGKKIISLDISSLVAGSKYRGDFEEKIKKVLAEVKKTENIIIFIDEIHTVVGAGAAEGAIDAANILKPMLARGEIKVIGATTIAEYRKYIEKDQALERRFSPVMLREPGTEETIKILKGIKEKFEAHHNIEITDEAIEKAVDYAKRYILDRYEPDKSIDLLDEAASMVKINTYNIPQTIVKLEKEIAKTAAEKEESIKLQDYETAIKLRNKEHELKNEINEERKKQNLSKSKEIPKIKEEHIAKVISKWTGIPINKVTESEKETLKKLETNLKKKIIGQPEAVKSIANSIIRGRLGLRNEKRPISSFIFLGPTGVGKTELAKALAVELFGSEKELIRIDMSEYMEQNSLSKLIGAPPGYVGFEEAGRLTEKVRKKPYSIVLFDEIEKAHPEIMNIFLQILEDGILTDSGGREINFKNTVIIMTSNIGAGKIINKTQIGFENKNVTEEEEYKRQESEVISELKKQYSPEFINRIDEIIVFRKLNEEDLINITRKMLTEMQEKLEDKGIKYEIEEQTIEKIVKRVKNQNYGARPIRKEIQKEIEDKLAHEILG